MSATIDKTPLAPSAKEVAGGRNDITWGVTVLVSPDGSVENRTWPIVQALTLGRAEDDTLDLVIRDGLLSRRHLTITNDSGDLVLHDSGSTNGTFVGQERIERQTIAQDCVVRVGETVLLVHEISLLPRPATGALMGESLALLELVRRIEEIARVSAPILILGETGTGKELVARQIAARNQRSGAFVAVNCGAIPKDLVEATFFGHQKGAFTGAIQQSLGLWQAADKGTLFLDEIGELPLEMQAALLRVIERGEFMRVGGTTVLHADVHIVAATNVDLKERAAAGTFRRDLFARLYTVPIHVPPLRARRVDIVPLFTHFWRELTGAAPRMKTDFAEALLRHDWPMNVRELRSLAIDLSTRRVAESLSAALLPSEMRGRAIKKSKKPQPIPSAAELTALLVRFNGRVASVAEHLGRHRKQVYRWIDKLEIRSEDYRKD